MAETPIMKIFIQAAEVFDPNSAYHRQKIDLLIEQGRILKIGSGISPEGHVISGSSLKISPGWIDMNTSFGDPGYEHKEDLESGLKAAAAGGFTGVVLLPNNSPVTQNKNAVSYLRSQNYRNVTQVYPLGAVTIETRGENLTEMLDLHSAGAIAFSDGNQPIWHTDIMTKALLYLQKINGLLIQRPEDIWLNKFGTMHEGPVSTMLGLKGMPSLAEEIIIERDLKLLEYTGGKLHFSKVSTRRAVELIRAARENGLQVSCDMASFQLDFTDQALVNFETNYKVNPPFRDQQDNDHLVTALLDDTIDVIVSSHQPHDEESKNLEFDLADFGIINLQTLWPQLLKLQDKVPLEKLIEKITQAPRRLLGLPVMRIEEGIEADLTVFDESEWQFHEKTNFSRSKNSPYLNQVLKGKVLATIYGNKVHFNQF